MSDWSQLELPGMPPPLVVADEATLSPGRRRTLRQRALLAQGVHPATGRALLGAGRWTCGDCPNLQPRRLAGNVVYKCSVHTLGPSMSAASDVRRSWPACELFPLAE